MRRQAASTQRVGATVTDPAAALQRKGVIRSARARIIDRRSGASGDRGLRVLPPFEGPVRSCCPVTEPSPSVHISRGASVALTERFDRGLQAKAERSAIPLE